MALGSEDAGHPGSLGEANDSSAPTQVLPDVAPAQRTRTRAQRTRHRRKARAWRTGYAHGLGCRVPPPPLGAPPPREPPGLERAKKPEDTAQEHAENEDDEELLAAARDFEAFWRGGHEEQREPPGRERAKKPEDVGREHAEEEDEELLAAVWDFEAFLSRGGHEEHGRPSGPQAENDSTSEAQNEDEKEGTNLRNPRARARRHRQLRPSLFPTKYRATLAQGARHRRRTALRHRPWPRTRKAEPDPFELEDLETTAERRATEASIRRTLQEYSDQLGEPMSEEMMGAWLDYMMNAPIHELRTMAWRRSPEKGGQWTSQ